MRCNIHRHKTYIVAINILFIIVSYIFINLFIIIMFGDHRTKEKRSLKGAQNAAFVTFYIDVNIFCARTLEGGGKVCSTTMHKLWSSIANFATILKVVDYIVDLRISSQGEEQVLSGGCKN